MKMENLNQHPGMKVEERYNLWAGKGNERRNVFEDIVAEEHTFQFIGSTNSNFTNARSITAKNGLPEAMVKSHGRKSFFLTGNSQKVPRGSISLFTKR
ncbi:hypothetical protein N7470_010100 [Penicillium chermesinum]|nr:hypothetical protein N7470_010100 [Penicillium chermesinum]